MLRCVHLHGSATALRERPECPMPHRIMDLQLNALQNFPYLFNSIIYPRAAPLCKPIGNSICLTDFLPDLALSLRAAATFSKYSGVTSPAQYSPLKTAQSNSVTSLLPSAD